MVGRRGFLRCLVTGTISVCFHVHSQAGFPAGAVQFYQFLRWYQFKTQLLTSSLDYACLVLLEHEESV